MTCTKPSQGVDLFVIGGGPSVSTILHDPNILDPKKHDIITVNNAYELYPDAKYHHHADRSWFNQNWRHFMEVCTSSKSSIYSEATQKGYPEVTKEDIRFWFRSESNLTDFVVRNDVYHGNWIGGHNSGHQAINIGYYLGYRRFYLIGFDMDNTVPNLNYHTKHKVPAKREMYEDFIVGFQRIAMSQLTFSFTVVNLNMNSKLTCFQKADIHDIL